MTLNFNCFVLHTINNSLSQLMSFSFYLRLCMWSVVHLTCCDISNICIGITLKVSLGVVWMFDIVTHVHTVRSLIHKNQVCYQVHFLGKYYIHAKLRPKFVLWHCSKNEYLLLIQCDVTIFFYYSCCSQLNLNYCMVFDNYFSFRLQYNACGGQGHTIVRLFIKFVIQGCHSIRLKNTAKDVHKI